MCVRRRGRRRRGVLPLPFSAGHCDRRQAISISATNWMSCSRAQRPIASREGAGLVFFIVRGPMRSKLTEEAINIIDAAPSQGPLRIAEYAKALPPRAAALRRVLLEDEEIGKAVERYREADFAALDAQARFRRLGWTAAYTGSLAAVLGGVLLYLASDASTALMRSNLGLVQSTLLSVSLLCAAFLFVFKPFREWGLRRGDAEAMRLQVFGLMMSGRSPSGDNEIPLLPLQLECFRRHLLDDQRTFFALRRRQHRRTVLIWKGLGAIAFLLVLGSIFVQAVRLEALGVPVDALRRIMASVALDQKAYALAGLIGGSLQGLLAALTVMSPAERNANKYKEMLSRLDKYTAEVLEKVRAGAEAGDERAVGKFALQITDDLAAECGEWLILQRVLSEMATRRLVEQPKRNL
jgi:hypothetical protein